MSETPNDYDAWAWLYDRTLGPDYRDGKMDFLDRVLLGRLPAGARVLDLCCGTGQMLVPMMARGFAVTGLDMSADMLRHAARNAPGAELVQGDARNFRLERPVAGVVCASASLNHMTGPEELERVLRSVHDALEAGGIFVFDINHPAQMARHWRGQPAAGEIGREHAWMITPRYGTGTATGAFRVDMYRAPEGGGSSTGPALLRAALGRPILRRWRLAKLQRFDQDHPDWSHRGIDYPVHGHELETVRGLLEACGFAARLETLSGDERVDADNAACFIGRKAAAQTRPEAAE